MGLHTGEPTVGEEGYLGMDVVRAARICSAGHGGQILLSETTRALVGNSIPEGTEVRDLGEANLKDVQHERIFELALAEQQRPFPPLKTAAPKTSADDLAAQIERRVHEQILAGFEPGPRRRVDGEAREAGARRVPGGVPQSRRAGRDLPDRQGLCSERAGAVQVALEPAPEQLLEPLGDGDQRVEVDTGLDPLALEEIDEILGGDVSGRLRREGAAAEAADGGVQDDTPASSAA